MRNQKHRKLPSNRATHVCQCCITLSDLDSNAAVKPFELIKMMSFAMLLQNLSWDGN